MLEQFSLVSKRLSEWLPHSFYTTSFQRKTSVRSDKTWNTKSIPVMKAQKLTRSPWRQHIWEVMKEGEEEKTTSHDTNHPSRQTISIYFTTSLKHGGRVSPASIYLPLRNSDPSTDPPPLGCFEQVRIIATRFEYTWFPTICNKCYHHYGECLKSTQISYAISVSSHRGIFC